MSTGKDSFTAVLKAAGFSLAEIDAYMDGRKKKARPPTVYEARAKGREYCQTQGSDHYIQPGPEAMDLIIACGYAKGFCLGAIIKYAVRYGETGNPNELKKIADMAHILCGVEMADGDQP
jgi:hypothetical protein